MSHSRTEGFSSFLLKHFWNWSIFSDNMREGYHLIADDVFAPLTARLPLPDPFKNQKW